MKKQVIYPVKAPASLGGEIVECNSYAQSYQIIMLGGKPKPIQVVIVDDGSDYDVVGDNEQEAA
jgi:hypothetical protein